MLKKEKRFYMGKDLLLLDWSTICYVSWFRQFSDNYEPEFDELTEFTRNVAKAVTHLVAKYDPEDIVIAMDPKGDYWRHQVVEDYYKTHADFYMDADDNLQWYADVDGIYYAIFWVELKQGWATKKLGEKAWLELGIDDSNSILYKNGETPQHILDEFEDIPTNIEEFPMWDGLKQVIPFYKGTRSSQVWKAKTSKKDFQKASLEMGRKMAAIYGGRAICVDGAEADDVVASACFAQPDSNIVMVTVDKDLHQLWGYCENLTIVNSQTFDEVDQVSPDVAMYDMWCKLLGGDVSDNIKGVRKLTKGQYAVVKKTNGQISGGKPTAKVLDDALATCENKFSNVFDVLNGVYDEDGKVVQVGLVDRESLAKNYELVVIKDMPEEIKSLITNALNNQEVESTDDTLQSYGLTELEVTKIVRRATGDVSDD